MSVSEEEEAGGGGGSRSHQASPDMKNVHFNLTYFRFGRHVDGLFVIWELERLLKTTSSSSGNFLKSKVTQSDSLT